MIALAALLASCSVPLGLDQFGAAPEFDPVAFFAGPIHSWGVLENRSGQPTAVILTGGVGVAEGSDGLHFPQRVQVGSDPATVRDWHMRRVAPGRFEATANDMVGTATGQASGRAFHWTWTLALTSGPFGQVTMDQWWFLQADGAMLNRTIITKLGIVVAEATEVFHRGEEVSAAPPAPAPSSPR